MKIFYDLHIHTALSPCGDEDMTPNNVVNMASLLGLDFIAITDHNSILNVKPCIKVAEGKNITIVPGVEVETSEEVHVVCLFDELEKCEVFGEILERNLKKIPLRKEIYGRQVVFDELDNEIFEVENLLSTSLNLGIYDVVESVKELGGIAIPAHVDRDSYSIISNLGFIPDDLGIGLVELYSQGQHQKVFENIKRFSHKEYSFIKSSDAHYLTTMREKENYFEFEERPNLKQFLDKLKSFNS